MYFRSGLYCSSSGIIREFVNATRKQLISTVLTFIMRVDFDTENEGFYDTRGEKPLQLLILALIVVQPLLDVMSYWLNVGGAENT